MKEAALLVLLFFTLFIAPSPSHADEDRTVQTLLGNCESDEVIENAWCAAFINGVATLLSVNCGVSKEGYSSPESLKADVHEVTNGALLQAFKNWAKNHPEYWSTGEAAGVVFAMSSTFPCKD